MKSRPRLAGRFTGEVRIYKAPPPEISPSGSMRPPRGEVRAWLAGSRRLDADWLARRRDGRPRWWRGRTRSPGAAARRVRVQTGVVASRGGVEQAVNRQHTA